MEKKRAVGAVVAILATAAVSAAAFKMGINPPISNIVGAYVSLAAFIAACRLIKAGDMLYYSGLIFVFMASPLGSIINLYRSFAPYDKIVHLLSGFLLAAFGMLIIELLLKKCSGIDDYKKFMLPMVFTAFMFASGGAGLWEIFEFAGDKLMGGQMQRGMVDTVTDMIAGNIGALIYLIFIWMRGRRICEKTV